MIRYPQALKKGDTIGVCAPSSGTQGLFIKRLDLAKDHLKAMGYQVIESNEVRHQNKAASSPAQVRAQAFVNMYKDPLIKAIIPPWGGELLMDILPLIDFEDLKHYPPKWVMGFSDISTLLFVLHIKLGIASAHGPNLLDFAGDPIHETVLESLEVLSQESGCEAHGFLQKSSQMYQNQWASIEKNILAPYCLTESTQWKNLEGEDEVAFEGRLIGGCMDVLCKLLGTPYGEIKTLSYLNTLDASHDKQIWYLESCEMNAADLRRTLLQMQWAGWFDHCSGIIFGRLEGYSHVGNYTFIDVMKSLQEALRVPILYDADLGHLPPQLTFINGAFANVNYHHNACEIVQVFKA